MSPFLNAFAAVQRALNEGDHAYSVEHFQAPRYPHADAAEDSDAMRAYEIAQEAWDKRPAATVITCNGVRLSFTWRGQLIGIEATIPAAGLSTYQLADVRDKVTAARNELTGTWDAVAGMRIARAAVALDAALETLP